MRVRIHIASIVGIAAVIASSSAFAGSGQPFKVTSTLDGKTVLPLRIHWAGQPHLVLSKVREVDFLIDGRLGWVERKSPFVYASDGNWLVTSFLTPGKHTFTTRVITTSGSNSVDSVRARVIPAPAPPSSVAGDWQRTVTAADVKKATSSQPPPAGLWKITINSRGWVMTDPQNGGAMFDVGYLSASRLQMRPTIETPPFPNPNNGGFCDSTDPLSTWTVSVSSAGTTMSLNPAHADPCGDRAAILQGTWTRTG